MPALRSRSAAVVLLVGALVVGAAGPALADPVALTASVAAPVVTLPIGDGYHDQESLVVTASSATTASVTLQRDGGAATTVQSALALPAGTTSIALPTDGLVAGTYTASIATTDGGAASASFTVAALHAMVTRIALKRSAGTVYAVKDGYRDTVVFTVTPTVSELSTAPVTGTATLTRAGHTAKSWKLHRGANRLTWNGTVGARVKPGKYTLTVRAKGPQGAAKTVRTSVVVSAKRLVSRTATITGQASAVFDRYGSYDGRTADCAQSAPYVACASGVAQHGEPYTVVVGGVVAVPKAVRSATAFGQPKLRVTLGATKVTGTAVWGYSVGTSQSSKPLTTGTAVGSWIRWKANPSTIAIYSGLKDNSMVELDRVVISYRYRTLV